MLPAPALRVQLLHSPTQTASHSLLPLLIVLPFPSSVRLFCNLFCFAARFLMPVPAPAVIILLNTGIFKSGPNKPPVQPIDAWTFLMLCRTRFPKAIISIGWTTQMDELSLKIGYTREMIDQMASLVKGVFHYFDLLPHDVTGFSI